MKIKKLLFACVFFYTSVVLNAQSISPQVLPTQGGYFAGGGVQGGRVVGRSDAIGGYPAERPVAPNEVVATIFHSLGLDLETQLPGPAGRPFALVDSGTKPITELF